MDAAEPAFAHTALPPLAAFFLDRLAVLVARQQALSTRPEGALLARAAFSVFLDCLALGRDAEVRALVALLHPAPAPVERPPA